MLGSGTTVAAPMAVKCSPQIASVSNPGATHNALRRSSSCQASSAAEASPMPIRIEASNEAPIPAERAGNDESLHAREVHEGDAAADDGAAGGDHRTAAARRNRKADNCRRGGDQQRTDGQDRVVAGGKARVVGQHRHEVGGPDAGAGAHAGQEHPRHAPRALLMRGIRVSVEGRERRCRANQRSQQHEPVVMLSRDAGENAQHEVPPLERLPYRIARVAQGYVKRHRRCPLPNDLSDKEISRCTSYSYELMSRVGEQGVNACCAQHCA